MWSGILKSLYEEGGLLNRKEYSLWWRDLKTLDECLPFAQDWFTDSVRSKLGNGTNTKFWLDKWCCQWSLKEVYPILYQNSDNQSGYVADFGDWINGRWSWRLNWAGTDTDQVHNAASLLMETLQQEQPDRKKKTQSSGRGAKMQNIQLKRRTSGWWTDPNHQ